MEVVTSGLAEERATEALLLPLLAAKATRQVQRSEGLHPV